MHRLWGLQSLLLGGGLTRAKTIIIWRPDVLRDMCAIKSIGSNLRGHFQ